MPEPKLEDLESIDTITRAWHASISLHAGKLPDSAVSARSFIRGRGFRPNTHTATPERLGRGRQIAYNAAPIVV